MAPRPRTVDDGEILAATQRAIARLGPVRLTLAEVGREVGLSAATLVQRFGSKRGLLLALVELGAASVDACFDAVRAAHSSPLAALLAAATEMARHAGTPEELANGLAFLQLDLSDPEFRAHALASSRRVQAGYRALLDEAVGARELARCDTAALARAIGAIAGGALIAWAIHREGSAERFVRADLDTLLAPHLRPAKTSAGRRRKAPAERKPRRKRSSDAGGRG